MFLKVGIGISSLCAFELFKEFGTSGNNDDSDDKFFNLAGIVIPIVGAFGSILWGLLGDKVSYKTLFIVGNVVCVILQVGESLFFKLQILDLEIDLANRY